MSSTSRSRRGRRPLDPDTFAVRISLTAGTLTDPQPLAVLEQHTSELLPVREPANTRYQRKRPSLFYFQTIHDHVTCRTRLAERNALLFDYDPRVIDLIAEPFALLPSPASVRSVTPDFLAILDRGVALIDLVSDTEAGQQAAQRRLREMSLAADALGWEHWVLGEPEHVIYRNLRWLSGYRRPMPHLSHVSEQMLSHVQTGEATIAELAQVSAVRALGLPMVFNLLWHRRLHCDLGEYLDENTPVRRARESDPPETGIRRRNDR